MNRTSRVLPFLAVVLAGAVLLASVSGCNPFGPLDNPLDGERVLYNYDIGDTGPAGGYVYYDKGRYADGWRYLEAAPAETEWSYSEWGGRGSFVGGTLADIGTGASNTTLIVEAYGESEPYDGQSDYAAKLCSDLEYDGYDDWFLPSKAELDLMYENLYSEGIGGFAPSYYWSSSEYDSDDAYNQVFGSGTGPGSKHVHLHVRASRTF